MKAKGFAIAVFLLGLGLLFIFSILPTHAQKQPRILTILFTNNINGEIDPCPT
ncbi:MAG: hypothetical protein QME90_18940 [Thermodesulfobacteriota bacterium]|nr:hypothetical protein [Thermodesulfobacteriota bacterium]